MFGLLSFRVKVLTAIRTEFRYEPDLSGKLYKEFKLLTKTIKKSGGNHYDGAIAYMFMQLDMLDSTDESSYDFRFDLVNNACFMSKKANLEITRDTAMELFREYDKDFSEGHDI